MYKMQNRIDTLFQTKKNNIISIYYTAGYPTLNDTLTIAKELQQCGIDMLEIGMPFSDPLADGPTIQSSSELAIKNGMTIEVLFNQLKDLRQHIKIPVILMGYYNPILQFGSDKFFKKAVELGIDGVIIPDLPIDDYRENYQSLFSDTGLKNILLITPQTSDSRIHLIDAISGGFIYAVSSASTTGSAENKLLEQEEYLNNISQMNLKNPFIVGFGINNVRDLHFVSRYANGAIIGSAFVRAITTGNLKNQIRNFIKPLL